MSTTTPNDLKSTTSDAFADLTGQFISALSEVFPECTGIREACLMYDLALKNTISQESRHASKIKLIEGWHEEMSPYYERASQKDPTLFDVEFPLFKDINLSEKWKDETVDNDTREAIWQYIHELNRLSQMHCGLFDKIPGNTMARIQSTAMELAQKIEGGSMTMADLNLAEIGQNVVEGLDENELNQFTQNILGEMSTIQNLCGGMLNGAMGQNNGANVNIGQAMQMMQMMQNGSNNDVQNMMNTLMRQPPKK